MLMYGYELLMMGEKLSETCRVVIPINLEFRASVGFIHKESVTVYGHAILKNHFTSHSCQRIIARDRSY